MKQPAETAIGWRDRLPPVLLAGVGILLAAVLLLTLLFPAGLDPSGWWVVIFATIPALVLGLGSAVLVIDPRPLRLRRVVAGAALAWLLFLAAAALGLAAEGEFDATFAAVTIVGVVDAGALLGLAATTPEMATEALGGPVGRLGAVVVSGIAVVVAAVVLVVAIAALVGATRSIAGSTVPGRVRWTMLIAILVLPALTFTIATIDARRAAGGTFYAQAAANRRDSLLLLVTLVGVLAATGELIGATLTFSSVSAAWAAGIAAVVGLGAALGADRFGSQVVLRAAGARPADQVREHVLLDVVREISLAAGVPEPQVFVIEEDGLNAFAIGRDASHAAITVTLGLLRTLDREELQGVVGHEMAHVRNLDTRYALYVAVLVGLVALVTDGFLRGVMAAWERGAFFSAGDSDSNNPLASLAAGLLLGLFLLLVAGLLRLVAPLFSALVQASVSREREFLADATSVELTRNPVGLERALASIAADTVELKAANRGTQHLWFRNPVKPGSDRRAGLFSTHPSIGARVERLRLLRGLAGTVVDTGLPATLADET